MFHMLTCCNLRPGTRIEAFQRALAEFSAHMHARGLVVSTGPVGRRQRHPVMDTDDERDHQYFFVMSFRDRGQCDQAVEHVTGRGEPAESLHTTAYAMVTDAVFICWEDV